MMLQALVLLATYAQGQGDSDNSSSTSVPDIPAVGTFCQVDAECGAVDCGGRESDQASCNVAIGRCECEPRAYFFLLFGVYLTVILGISVYSYGVAKAQRNRNALSTQHVETPHTVLRDYFLPDARFGIPVMGLTMVATVTSGYTIVGVPNEASIQGLFALRWLLLGVSVAISMLVFFPRFREVGLTRNYAAPSDLITDRFRCQSLRLVSTGVMLFVLFVYTTAQFKAIYDILDVIALGRIDAGKTTFLVAFVVVLCDWIGGQRGVSLSDVAQASLILIAYTTVPFFLIYYFRPLEELPYHCTDQPCLSESRPYFLMTPTVTGVCDYLNRATDPDCFYRTFYENAGQNATQADLDWNRYLDQDGGVDVDVRTEFDHQTLSMFGFIMNGFSFPLQAPFVQKIFLARDTRTLKYAMVIVVASNLVISLPSFYYGLLAATEFPKEQVPAYPLIVGKLMNQNGLTEVVAVVALNAVIAAVMSTGDSTVIGANNIFSVTWMKGFLLPGMTTQVYVGLSMVFSMIFAMLTVVFAISTDTYFGTLLNLQNSVNWQLVPTFATALYSDRVAAYPLLFGMLVGLSVCIILEAKVASDANYVPNSRDPDATPISQHYEDGSKTFSTALPSGLWAAMVNIFVVALSQWGLEKIGSTLANDSLRTRDRPHTRVTDEYGDERLTAKQIREEIMKVHGAEPYTKRISRIIVIVQVVLIFMGLPWYREPFTKQPLTSAFPSWAVWCTVCGVIAIALQLFVLSQWKTSTVTVAELRPQNSRTSLSINASYAQLENQEAIPEEDEMDDDDPPAELLRMTSNPFLTPGTGIDFDEISSA